MSLEVGDVGDSLALWNGGVRESISLRPFDDGTRIARRFVIVTLRRWHCVELIFEASQVVTELVDMATARPGDEIDLVLIREPRQLRVEVYDGSHAKPASTAEVRGFGRRAS